MGTLRIGLCLNTELAAGETEPDRRFAELAEQVAAARDYGFSAIGVPHHHSLAETQWLHPLVTLAALAPLARGMDLATIVYLIGHYHPLEVAQQVATLDAVCGGRLRLGVAPGWAKPEFDALGLPYGLRASRFTEALEVLKLLWSGERVTHHGRHFKLDGVRLAHLPVQRPHPPIWMGASVPKAAARIAELADVFVMSSHPRVSEVEPAVAAYRRALAELGKPEPPELPILRNFFVAASREEAEREALPFAAVSYGGFARWKLFDRVLSDAPTRDEVLADEETRASLDNLREDRIILGSPGEVVAELQALQSRLGVGLVFLRVQWPGLKHAAVLRCLELVGREVLPRLRSASV